MSADGRPDLQVGRVGPTFTSGGGNLATAFDEHVDRYERWFDEHRAAYESELLAVRALLPLDGRGLEIGVGTGRFAAPLGVGFGVDPSCAMLSRAAARGVRVALGTAEALPFYDASFDYVLLVTTLCFVASPGATLAEARRVLRPGGALVLAFIDRDTPLGHLYEASRSDSVFYRDAKFHSTAEVERLLQQGGFTIGAWCQTLSQLPGDMPLVEPVRPGTGEGAFVVVAATLS